MRCQHLTLRPPGRLDQCIMRTGAPFVAFSICLLLPLVASAQFTNNVIKIGVLTDQSGLWSDMSGRGSVEAAKMAVEDFGGSVGDTPIEVIDADHQNKPNIGAAIAAGWIDVDKVDVIVDVPNSGVALAVAKVVADKNRVFIASGAATPNLTGKACAPTTVHWTYDTWALGHGTARELVKAGGDTWFFVTADYAFGRQLQEDMSATVVASGGKVVGSVLHQLNENDFRSALLKAQASGAKVIGLANAGADTIKSIRDAAALHLAQDGRKLASFFVTITDVHSLGLERAQGLEFASAFYWDRNEQSRAWSRRFAVRNNGRMPTMVQAGVYASVLHYLKATRELGADGDGKALVAKMKSIPTDDWLFGRGRIRPDGRKVHSLFLYEVKKPSESKGPWDYYKLLGEIPADQAFRPLSQGDCPLVAATQSEQQTGLPRASGVPADAAGDWVEAGCSAKWKDWAFLCCGPSSEASCRVRGACVPIDKTAQKGSHLNDEAAPTCPPP
jgi:branched-chain amino acid transport system substrate-binding protein